MNVLPPSYEETRENLHRLACYVISPARAATNPRAVALRPTPGGFGTAPYGEMATVIRVDGTSLVREDGASVRSEPITSLAAAAALAGVEPALELEQRFDLPPAGDPSAPLAVDEASSHAIGEWFALAFAALGQMRAEARPEDAATIVRIWPEHFDAAMEYGSEADGLRGTIGASPGDRHHATPYLYASVWKGHPDSPFWNAVGFRGAWLRWEDIDDDPHEAALTFFRTARRQVLGY